MPKISNEVVKVVSELKATKITYEPEEIREIIEADIRTKGYVVNDFKFTTKAKYVSDEWGMNSHMTSVFTGAAIGISCGGLDDRPQETETSKKQPTFSNCTACGCVVSDLIEACPKCGRDVGGPQEDGEDNHE